MKVWLLKRDFWHVFSDGVEIEVNKEVDDIYVTVDNGVVYFFGVKWENED